MSKVMCMILNYRLSRAAEEEGLTATVMNKEAERVQRLGAIETDGNAEKSQGMMIMFIDFSKAYDKVDRDKLWKCL